MPEEPQIKALSKRRRSWLFGFLVVVFLMTLPAIIFYTTGYRLNFSNEEDSTIFTTGGIYITTDNLEVDVYLDDRLIEKPRLFRSAYYIQSVVEGKHRVVVQRPDLQTWVKELAVDPRIVVEAASFNMPVIPHLRPITEYVTNQGEAVYFGFASSTSLFGEATTTVPIYATTSVGTSTYRLNEEYVFVESLFSSNSTSTLSVFDRFLEGVDRFRFATSSEEIATTTVEEFIEKDSIRLVEKENDIYAVWLERVENIPHYFCVPGDMIGSTTERYGQHVTDAFLKLEKSTTTKVLIDSDRICRPHIKLNRLRQDVFFYDFYPDSRDLVLLKLEDGLYVTEIDDRAWQNTQLIYPGKDFRVLTENNVIYIQDGDYYFELITEIEPT